MRQIGLFDSSNATASTPTGSSSSAGEPGCASRAAASKHNVRFYPDFTSWQAAAYDCLAGAVTPDNVWWDEDRTATRVTLRGSTTDQPVFSPAEFIDQARAASCHSNEDKWALLYSILWRMNHHEPQVLELAGDPEVAVLRRYSKAVARDVHKMKAFVRFRKVKGESPRYISWFEPQHLIVEYAAPFFKRRFANMQWSILTPVGCAHWEGGGQLWFSDAVEQQVAPAGDLFEEAWRVYYKSIFNPARLKVTAMQSEMPKKYWKNLPEAQEIQSLIAAAEVTTRRMIDQRKLEDNLHCGPRPSHPNQLVQYQLQSDGVSPLHAVKLQASLCSECPQGDAATQTVFGVGPEDASIMIIGEQPGDLEDLQGTPLVGPAGEVLTAALKRADIDRDQCYLTNAVKHFGFVPRGKRRIHKRPEASVVSACGHWLQQELQIVDPDIVIYLGATAASTRFGREVRIQKDRGRVISLGNRRHMITAHPSSILRMERGPAQQRAYVQFVNDLILATQHRRNPTPE